MTVTKYIAAIDQGTTSSRCMIFDRDGDVVGVAQKEHEQIFPEPGWVEHDPEEIWTNTREMVGSVLAKTDLTAKDIAAVGITNQRETTVVWDRETGKPVYNAIVWQDTRTDSLCDELGGDEGRGRFRETTGLPLSTYFSGPKVRWILDNVDGARERAEAGELAFGTIDSWIIWNLTGGLHITDVTNASRTLLMDLETLDWDHDICAAMGIPVSMLPEIRSSSEVYGDLALPGISAGIPIAGILGDQQAATFGQACLSEGEAKNTYGTGNFLLLNTAPRRSTASTVCSPRSATSSATSPPSTPWRGRWPSPARWCSGCVTTSESSSLPRTSNRWHRPSRTTAVRTSCPPSRVCSRRGGVPMRAASSPDSPDTSTRVTWRAPHSRPPRTRPARSSRPCAPTRGSNSRRSRSTAAWWSTRHSCSSSRTSWMSRSRVRS